MWTICFPSTMWVLAMELKSLTVVGLLSCLTGPPFFFFKFFSYLLIQLIPFPPFTLWYKFCYSFLFFCQVYLEPLYTNILLREA